MLVTLETILDEPVLINKDQVISAKLHKNGEYYIIVTAAREYNIKKESFEKGFRLRKPYRSDLEIFLSAVIYIGFIAFLIFTFWD
jgi:hypothetical protein